jgi:cell division protein FtsW
LSVPLLAITGVLLVLVLHPAAGTVAGGSARWIALGPVTIQPSEFAKLAMVAFSATVLTRKWKTLSDPVHLLLPLGLPLALVCGLIMLQPDLGTTLIVAGSLLMMLFVSGLQLRYLLGTCLAGGGLGLALIMAEGYRRERLFAFLHPLADRTNEGYQLFQSLVALGSGGWLGVGLGQSRQKWMYVPNAHTDFIFSILGEELGLIGEIVVLALFGALIYTGIRIAVHAPDTFGRLLAGGIVSWLGLQTLVNLGAVTGLLPITGVPLPLVSFGGSSLVVTLAAIGILVNIGRSPPPKRKRA